MNFSPDLDNLNGWRGLLALLVFGCHSYQIFLLPLLGKEGILAFLVSLTSSLAVIFFIILSGFVIGYSERSEHKAFAWKTYLLKRFSRIYPSYLMVVILSAILIFIFRWLNDGSSAFQLTGREKYLVREEFWFYPRDLFYGLLMQISSILQVNGPLWSLVLEWWLYISAMFVLLILKGKASILHRILFFLLMFAPFAYLYYVFSELAIFYIIIWYLGFFYVKLPEPRRFVLFAAAAAILVIFTVKYRNEFITAYYANDVRYGIFQVFASVVFLYLAFRVRLPRFFKVMSDYSYTLYVLHFPLLLFTFGLSHRFTGGNILKILLVIAFADFLIFQAARYLGRFTEDKYYFRNLLSRIPSLIDARR